MVHLWYVQAEIHAPCFEPVFPFYDLYGLSECVILLHIDPIYLLLIDIPLKVIAAFSRKLEWSASGRSMAFVGICVVIHNTL